MRYGSLFTGIGGIDLGLDMAGMECVWQVEVDDYCTQVLEKRWPNATRYRDIFELNGKELESVDLICGGFPCQPVSVAGRRGGTSDERWLWGEFARIIRQVKPRWVVAENVTGLLSANSGRAFAEVLRDLAEGGYNVVWDVFPAGGQGGVGAPHKRERIFIVAYSDGSRWDAQSLSRTIRMEGKTTLTLTNQVKGCIQGLWPTPTVSDTEGGLVKNVELRNGSFSRKNKKGVRWGVKLKDAVNHMEMFPTPTARDWKGKSGKGRQERKGNPKDTLPNAVNGQLNPTWVEWLMGFPRGWTDLKHLEMPLSRKSQNKLER